LSQKVICDPVHNHIYIDRTKEKVILDLLGCQEIQRLRRIHQLGVSYYTYPGAEHSRFSHALGVYHLIRTALDYVQKNEEKKIGEADRAAAVAAALLHDLGHGPFSHVLEKEYGNKHEKWTENLIKSGTTETNRILAKHYGRGFPERIVQILFNPTIETSWLNALLSSQLDVDRMDYLLRDSYFCGIEYGKFDYRWIFHTMRIRRVQSGNVKLEQPVWIEKAARALEDYIFARYNMYWAVYYHRCTRGYEELLKTILRRAEHLIKESRPLEIFSKSLGRLIVRDSMTADDLLALDDSVAISHFLLWKKSKDKILKDLVNRFLSRRGFKWVDFREDKDQVSDIRTRERVRDKIKAVLKNRGYDPEYYLLESISAAKAYDFYHIEKEPGEQTAKNTIFVLDKDDTPVEISSIPEMKRLKIMAGEREVRKFYYVPDECRDQVRRILDKF